VNFIWFRTHGSFARKLPEWSCPMSICWVKRETGSALAFVVDMLEFKQVNDGVRGRVQVGGTGPHILLILGWTLMAHVCSYLSSYFLWHNISARSLSSSKTHRVRKTISLLERDTHIHFTRPVASNTPAIINPVEYNIWGTMQQWATHKSSWRWGTDKMKQHMLYISMSSVIGSKAWSMNQ